MQKPGFSVPILILLLFCASIAHAQRQNCKDILINFCGNNATVDSAYQDKQSVRELCTTAETKEIMHSSLVASEVSVARPAEWTRHLHLKTNMLGLGLAIANVAVEVDLARQWSFTLPVYYSAWDYFKSTTKFRTLAFQPEFRYWPWAAERNDGFFTGAHFGLAYYNIATNGKYRYQDHLRKTPAIGGGVSVGYRLPIDRCNRWRIEFSVGAGVYSLHYDKFHNTSPTKEGLMINSEKKTYLGIDQAAISFSYTFNLNRKGGRR